MMRCSNLTGACWRHQATRACRESWGHKPPVVVTTPGSGVSARQRALAIVALCSVALAFAAITVFLVRNVGSLVVGLVGLAVAISGGWWMITERVPRRVIGAVALLLGVIVIAVAVAGVDTTAGRTVVRLVLVGAAIAIAMVTARISLADVVHQQDHRRPRQARRPRHPVLLCNPWSGGGKVVKFRLAELASELGIETVILAKGLDLEELARDAIARGADCLGMAGGDGSQALVASIAVEHDLPFVCVSAGTRNHFALDLGLNRDDPRQSVYAFRDAVERHVDFATVNGRVFVNNVSLGVYATIVQQDSYRDAKVETSMELLPELLGRTQAPFDLQFSAPDGTEVDGSFLILVSNDPYVLGPSLDLSQRRRLDAGKLGIVALSAATGREAAEVITLSAIGARNQSRHWHEFTAETFEVRSRSGTAFTGVDGEALQMETPLEFRIHPSRLRLLVPEGNLTVAEQRRARDIRAGDLLSLARGKNPGAQRTEVR